MSYNRRDDDWLDADEYPDERDIRALGDESPYDDDPLTIGYVPGVRQPFWTRRRIIVGVIALLIVLSFLLFDLLPLLPA